LIASHYNRLEKWLHRLALSGQAVPEMAFNIEKRVHGRSLPEDQGHHVFVAGLARSGSTLLMRLLYDTGEFSSLTYRDMPFVLCPNSWSRLAGNSSRSVGQQERAHGDGLMVNVDSPEALEEVFWRTFCGEDYIGDSHLRAMSASADTLEDFRTYIRLVLKCHGGQRYLSKNNNNILRLNAIARAFPRATLLIPFRHPVSQSLSLLQQHHNFRRQQASDPFVRRYMDWLVHCEFGPGHRPFFAPADEISGYSPDDAHYWLALWIHTYDHILRQAEGISAVRYVCYESLCASPGPVWQALSASVGMTSTLPRAFDIRASRDAGEDCMDDQLVAKAGALYSRLRELAL
jgi:Sulfotransferase family